MTKPYLFYSWFSDPDEMPELVRSCMASWNLLGERFNLINMNLDWIDLHDITSPYLTKVLNEKLWSHASDYLRFYSLYHFGGLYLDTDVEVVSLPYEELRDDIFIPKESKSDYVEAAILWFKDGGNDKLRKLLDLYDELLIDEMTYKEIKLLIAPEMMKRAGFKVTGVNRSFIHHFNGHWIDTDIVIMDDLDIPFNNKKWNKVESITQSTRYVITQNKQDFGEYKNLSIEEHGLDYIIKYLL